VAVTQEASQLGPAVVGQLPPAIRAAVGAAHWWADELAGLHLMTGLNELTLPDRLPGYRRVDGALSRQWPRRGHALVHETSIVHPGVSYFGPVLVGPDCELGPHATIYGPTIVESGSYLGPSAEIRRCLLLAGAEVSHMSYVGHSVLGRRVRLGAFFCSAVRNLRRGTVHLLRDGVLVDTGEVAIGCVLADGTQTGVHVTVMPGRRIVRTPVVMPNAIVTRNC
jgi:UDP-N-acetylglucosamine diphosphorylase / glucose-1-phosphate thymidylyltransferase / UDP-N-acetylgalactosamine diphosphorylase / glucosamine-1-phosphate N-acetyltransferase / galactosamine-1-phosphate N-acetyltransferase